jgi:predicted RNase H-like HicB family nuclease
MVMRSYVFKVVVEPDADKWYARVPQLESEGAATWGNTREEAFRNIQEVARMVIEDMLQDGEPLPDGVMVSEEPLVSVTV